MTSRRPSLAEAADQHDVTLALSGTQLVLIAISLFLLQRVLRALRG